MIFQKQPGIRSGAPSTHLDLAKPATYVTPLPRGRDGSIAAILALVGIGAVEAGLVRARRRAT